MTQLSSALTAIRGIQQLYLNQVCTIQYPAFTPDTSGGETTVWTNRATGVKCRVASTSASALGTALREIAGIQQSRVVTTITLPFGTVLNIGDRVVCDGHTYSVTANVSQGTIETAVRRTLTEIL